MKKRAVITGIGLLSPLGNDPESFFNNALRGISGIKEVKKFDTSKYSVHIGGEIDFQDEPELSESLLAEASSVTQWSVRAARKAVADAKLEFVPGEYSIDIVTGMSISAIDCLSRENFSEVDSKLGKAASNLLVLMNPAGAAVQIGRDLGICGEATNVSSACSSSTTAIGYAARLIQHGESTCVLTGGADEGVSRLFFATFANAMSKRTGNPSQISCPFDRRRDGAVLSDAACMFVIEELDSARRRGAHIYCEVAGFGATSEATSAFKLCKSEESSAVAVEQALKRANRGTQDIDYFCAQGLSHPFLDIRETRMMKRVFKEDARKLTVSSIKSVMGHPLGAAGAIQTAACAMAIKNGAIPPTINYGEPDPECDLDYVPNIAREKVVKNAMVYTLGNGGANAALVLSAL